MQNKLGKITEVKELSDNTDLPPGQFVTEKFPALTAVPAPEININNWLLTVFGLVNEELKFNWNQFMNLPQVTIEAPFHCVTQWSNLNNTWTGVLFSEINKLFKCKPQGKFAMIHSYGGYTTNLLLENLQESNVIFAHSHNGKPLNEVHGGPLRLVVPKFYGWKSAKWVNGIEIMEQNKPGFWEERGYHMQGDPWNEERFWPDIC